MADTIKNNYKDIADAIRAKKGTSNLMTPQEMVSEIADILKPTGTLDITENGEGIDVTMYAAVNVDVQGGGGPGDGVWWIKDGEESVNLTSNPGLYSIGEEAGDNPPEQLYLSDNYWYRYSDNSLDTNHGIDFSTNYAYAYSSDSGGTFSYGLSLDEAYTDGQLIHAVAGGCGAMSIAFLQDTDGYEINLYELEDGQSVTFELELGSVGHGHKGTFTITKID